MKMDVGGNFGIIPHSENSFLLTVFILTEREREERKKIVWYWERKSPSSFQDWRNDRIKCHLSLRYWKDFAEWMNPERSRLMGKKLRTVLSLDYSSGGNAFWIRPDLSIHQICPVFPSLCLQLQVERKVPLFQKAISKMFCMVFRTLAKCASGSVSYCSAFLE
jgi:hypothetical protein